MKKYLSIAAFSIAAALSLNSLSAVNIEANNEDGKEIILSSNDNQSKLPKTVALSDNSRLRNALICPDVSIIIDGSDVYFKNAAGEAVYPILYDGVTYLPLRAVGVLMSKNVNWDEKNKIISISGKRASVSSDSPNKNIGRQKVTVQERPDFTILIENDKKEFYSVSGERMYPMLYNGSTYLPLRSIGEIMNKEVLWDSSSKTVMLRDFMSSTVTDADSFNSFNGDKQGESTEDNNLSGKNTDLRRAKEEALNHAGAKEDDVTFTKAKMDYEDGKLVYEIEFYKDGKEYEYEIDAKTNEIIKFDADLKDNSQKDVKKKESKSNKNGISIEEAKNIALKHANINKSDAVFIKEETDYDDGIYVYEIEYQTEEMEYEFKIDADTGKVMEYESEQK